MNMQMNVALAPATFTATELRKTFFQHLDKAMQGESVRFTYKGARLQISLEPGSANGSKMSRLVHREGLDDNVDLDATKELLPQWEANWAADAERDFSDLYLKSPEGNE
jgi:hypothetical protein